MAADEKLRAKVNKILKILEANFDNPDEVVTHNKLVKGIENEEKLAGGRCKECGGCPCIFEHEVKPEAPSVPEKLDVYKEKNYGVVERDLLDIQDKINEIISYLEKVK